MYLPCSKYHDSDGATLCTTSCRSAKIDRCSLLKMSSKGNCAVHYDPDPIRTRRYRLAGFGISYSLACHLGACVKRPSNAATAVATGHATELQLLGAQPRPSVPPASAWLKGQQVPSNCAASSAPLDESRGCQCLLGSPRLSCTPAPNPSAVSAPCRRSFQHFV